MHASVILQPVTTASKAHKKYRYIVIRMQSKMKTVLLNHNLPNTPVFLSCYRGMFSCMLVSVSPPEAVICVPVTNGFMDGGQAHIVQERLCRHRY